MAPQTAKKSSGATTVLGMGACYALGTFTDNFFKQAAILMAAAAQLGAIQSLATILFSLPFIVFSAWAGWLADRLPKKRIVVGAKSLELLALAVGGLMLVQEAWAGIVAVIFVMGCQSTLFSPAINGSIPENFPSHQVPRVNSLIKLASTAAILAGMALAGGFLDMRPQSMGGNVPDALMPGLLQSRLGLAPGDGAAFGRAMAALFILAVAVLGLLTAFALRLTPAAGGKEAAPPFPWTGPLDSFRHVLECRKDPELFTVLACEAFFYGIAAIAVISIANMATGFGYSNTIAGAVTAVLMIGIAAGSLAAGRRRAESWRRLLAPSALGMSFTLLLAGLSPLLPSSGPVDLRLSWMSASLFLCGFCGGVYLIPLSSFIQIRPAAAEKGKVLAVSNFMAFSAMALSGAAFQLISLLPPNLSFIAYALSIALFLWLFALPRMAALRDGSLEDDGAGFLGTLLRALLSLRYKVAVSGLDAIPAQIGGQSENACGEASANGQRATAENGSGGKVVPGILFMPNHPALVDPLIVYSRLAGLRPRPLSDESQLRGLLPSLAARIVRAVTIPDLEKEGRRGRDRVKEGIARVVDALRRGDNVLLYPAGRVYRSAEDSVGGNSAAHQIVSAIPGLRVVLVRTTGLWGSSFSRAGGKKRVFMRSLLRGMGALLANAFFFMPKRRVSVEFFEPADLPRSRGKLELNAYLDAFYSGATRPAATVPRFFWQGSEPVVLPEKKEAARHSDADSAPEQVRQRVWELLREQAGLAADHEINADTRLRTELHLDSLALMDLVSAMEKEFGCSLPSLEGLETAGDCLAAASGQGQGGDESPTPAPAVWFSAEEAPDAKEELTVLHGPEMKAMNVPQAFLRLARKGPNRPLAADRGGTRTRRQMLIGALALAGRFKKLPGRRLGVMLPAAPAALAVWLGCLMAGKEPVFLNWTLGPRNMRLCIESAGISQVITASALLDQLERMDLSVKDLPAECIAADKLALSKAEKLSAALKALLHCSPLPWSLSFSEIPQTAAILFTSGSEAAPKAVPLSHTNIMLNAADVATVLKVRNSDRLLAMLPPFHSFGLLTGLTLPAISGIAAAYHPNPTESARLVALTRDFKLTVMGATPTFLESMLERAQDAGGNGGEDSPLSSLRYVFVGAEKCPDHVWRAFARACPKAALCEGYGITECSPVVSVNLPGKAAPGSIGQALPSVSIAVTREDESNSYAGGPYLAERVRPGEQGMLLVRGGSVFAGYLAPENGQSPPPDPFVFFEGLRWYRTGDLVSQDASGRLFFQGRLKRFVKTGGEMISLPLMESLLQEAFAQREDLPGEGKPFIAVEARAGSEEAGQAEILAFSVPPLTVQEINAVFRKAGLSPVFAVKRVVRVREIPLLGTGKTDYRALKGLT